MANNNRLKIPLLPGGGPLETTEVDGTIYVREADGTWRYADSWLKVPGARDVTLTEYFRPKLVMAGDRVERVVISADDIDRAPTLLNWALAEGTPIRGADGVIEEILIPIEAWEAHDRVPRQMAAPEHSVRPAEQELALAERAVREAERDLEIATLARAEALRRHSNELTRQEARAITDLSVGRIQQLIRDGVDTLDDLDAQIISITGQKAAGNVKALAKRLDEQGIDIPPSQLRSRIVRLRKRGLLAEGSAIGPTTEGKEMLASQLAARMRANTPE